MLPFLRTNRTTFFLILAGAILMGFGVGRGEMALVLRKAVNLCLECIGIG